MVPQAVAQDPRQAAIALSNFLARLFGSMAGSRAHPCLVDRQQPIAEPALPQQWVDTAFQYNPELKVRRLDIESAGMLAAVFSLPASIFRALGGWISDRWGARKVMYWTFIVSVACTFFLSYPSTDYIIHGIEGPIRFTIAAGVAPFAVLTLILGFFMSLGMAAVYKHIPVYYPDHVGSVGGLVGMIGGLGGFVLPIAFGAMNDLTGVWTSCFMLLFALVAVALTWMHFAIMLMEKKMVPELRGPKYLPELGQPESKHEAEDGGEPTPVIETGDESEQPELHLIHRLPVGRDTKTVSP